MNVIIYQNLWTGAYVAHLRGRHSQRSYGEAETPEGAVVDLQNKLNKPRLRNVKELRRYAKKINRKKLKNDCRIKIKGQGW